MRALGYLLALALLLGATVPGQAAERGTGQCGHVSQGDRTIHRLYGHVFKVDALDSKYGQAHGRFIESRHPGARVPVQCKDLVILRAAG